MGGMSGSLVVWANDILVEDYGPEPPRTLWVCLRSQDLDTADAQSLRWLLDTPAPPYKRCSILVHALGSRFEIRQDITAPLYAHADAMPATLPVLTEHFASGALFVWDENKRQLHPERAVALLTEALRWCADDYHDLLEEFQEQLEAAA